MPRAGRGASCRSEAMRDWVSETREVHRADMLWIGTVGLEDQAYLATDLKGAALGVLDGVVVPLSLSQCQHVVTTEEARMSIVATSQDVFAMARPEVAAAAEYRGVPVKVHGEVRLHVMHYGHRTTFHAALPISQPIGMTVHPLTFFTHPANHTEAGSPRARPRAA